MTALDQRDVEGEIGHNRGMVDPQPGPGRPLDEAQVHRWWRGPRVGEPSYGVRMTLAVTATALITACLVGLALLLDSRASRWEGPVVFGLGVVIALFYGWAIYSTVRPVPVARPGVPVGPVDDPEPGGPASEGVSSP